jgi:hypothetical protein
MEINQNIATARDPKTVVSNPAPRWNSTSPYEPLGQSQIRLLQILRSDDEVHCTISSHNLSIAPSFVALSYTWGLPHRDIHKLRKKPSSPGHQISCNGTSARIGENLYDFLAHCARDEGRVADGYYWIDALRQVVHVRATCETNANFIPISAVSTKEISKNGPNRSS